MNLTEFDLDGVITAPQPMELKVKSRNFEANRNLPNNQNKDLKSQSPQTLVKQEVRSISVHKELEKILKPLDALYPIEQRLDLGPYVHWRGNAAEPMHRWLRYREAYSPELIDKLNLGGKILDPFSGCGSIPIGAAVRGKKAVGIDLNPIAAFSTRVKLNPLSKNSISKLVNFSQELQRKTIKIKPWPLPELSIAKKVFEPKILDLVLKTRSAIEAEFSEDKSARDFAFLAWISVLETVGSYFKEGNGIKYRNKKRQKGKYEDRPDGEWQLARFGKDQRKFFLNAFTKQLQIMLDDTREWKSGSWTAQKLIEGSAFDLEKLVKKERFDSVIFSPPYANRFDYFESFKVELWFGNFVNSYEELNALRKASLRSHLNADYKRPSDKLPALEELLDLMDKTASSWRMGVPDLMRGYFHDIGIVLAQCKKVAPKGKCHVVVGNSAFAGVIIPTDVLTAMVGIEAGFKKARIIETRHLTVSPQQRNQLKGFEHYMRESIVVLE